MAAASELESYLTGTDAPVRPDAVVNAERRFRPRKWASVRHRTPDSHWANLRGNQPSGAQAAAWACKASTMLQEDVQLALADRYTRGELASLRWLYLPGRKTAAAKRNAKHLNINFGLISEDPRAPGSRWCERAWPDYIQTIARAATTGWRTSAVEFDYEIVPRNGRRRGVYWVKNLVDLPPQFHQEFRYQRGRLAAESNTWAGPAETYPASHLHVVTIGQEGTNLYGDGGMLYPCRASYNLAQLYRRLTAVGGEKWAIMTPTMSVDRKAASDLGYEDEDVDDMIEQGYSVLERYVAGESTALLTNPAVSFTTYGNPNFDPTKMLEVLKYTDNLKLRAYLLNLLAMGSSDTGARNIGDHLRGAHRTLLISLADTIAAAHSGAPRPGVASLMRCLDMTYGPQHPLDYPVLAHFGVREHPLADLLPHVPHWLVDGVDIEGRGAPFMRGLLQLAQVDPDEPVDRALAALGSPSAAPVTGRRPRMANLDPSAGGVPAKPGV